ncbi:hypothetical protein CHUAL_013511 [Chamberlinius hualienensis]
MDTVENKKCKKYTCAVAVCKQQRAEDEISFHKFPVDKARQIAWIIRCRRKDTINVINGRVCSLHFLPEHFKEDEVNIALGLPSIKVLTKDAIPTLHLIYKENCSMNERAERLSRTVKEKELKTVKSNLFVPEENKDNLKLIETN